MTNNKTGFGWAPAIAAALLLLVSPQAIAHQDCETCEEQYEFDSDSCASDLGLCEIGCLPAAVAAGGPGYAFCSALCLADFASCARDAHRDLERCRRSCVD